MLIKGKYATARVMVDEIDEATETQIGTFVNNPAFANSHIRIMPDCHAGAGAVIGFTAILTVINVIPNIVGVDIGCGIIAYPLEGIKSIDFEKFDKYVKRNIPSGRAIRSTSDVNLGKRPADWFGGEFLKMVKNTAEHTNQDLGRVIGSIGTLGGGNHFIEIDQAINGDYWLLVHSGSRNFGLKIANYYQAVAKKELATAIKEQVDFQINMAKASMKKSELATTIKELAEYKRQQLALFNGLENLVSDSRDDYLDDMLIAQTYAEINRRVMAEILLYFFGIKWDRAKVIETVHNYINFEDEIIRKGAVSAHKDEKLIIPFNMRDGVAICTGKGNNDWNYSAPHGSGRIMSRSQAKKNLKLEDFKASMKGIYTTTATKDTLDEAPDAYKGTLGILMAIEPTVDIDFMMKPVYNFKAEE